MFNKNISFYLKVIIVLFSSPLFSQKDCVTAIPICGDIEYNHATTGYGNLLEGYHTVAIPCAKEDNSTWYKFTIATGGTLTFDIIDKSPSNNAGVYTRFSLFGPDYNCDINNPPIRCYNRGTFSFAYTLPSIGLDMTSTTIYSYGVYNGTQSHCQYLTVQPGETYYLMIYTGASQKPPEYSIKFGGTATLQSPYDNPSLAPHPFLQPGPQQNGTIEYCTLGQNINLTSFTPQILNGNTNFTVSYYNTPNDAVDGINPITGFTTAAGGKTIYYTVQYTGMPPQACKMYRQLTFVDKTIAVQPGNTEICATTPQNQGVFNLDTASASMYTGTTPVSKKYYPTAADAAVGTNEITTPTAYLSASATIYVKFFWGQNCNTYAPLSLIVKPQPTAQDAALSTCFLAASPSQGTFNLTSAAITADPTLTRTYYATINDANMQSNPITTPTNYTSVSGIVFARVSNAVGCYKIVKIVLTVKPPYDSPLKDTGTCPDTPAKLDAGAGADAYLWSTGATSQTIFAAPGDYWVQIKKDGCTTQLNAKVTVYPSPKITRVDSNNATITVTAEGGAAPYSYSIDGISWQPSNIFTNVTRGDHTILVKDSRGCTPATTAVTVLNLVNVITPNGDMSNDTIDYHELQNKKNLDFRVYDRYGTEIFHSNARTYIWDGKKAGKLLPTGTYWYTISWIEHDTPISYQGWILLRN